VNRLKEIRTKLGQSQKQIANLVGISRCFYTQIENGTRKPSLIVAIKLSEALGIPVNEIFLDGNAALGNANGDSLSATGTEGR